jgi:peptidoglycan/LPS O-acetylase OafA/YrhL
MAKARKRLDRFSFWKRIAFFLVAYAIAIAFGRTISIAFVAVNVALIIWLAIILAWRFRDIGWRAWIGPTILFSGIFGLVLFAGLYAMQREQLIELIAFLRVIGGAALSLLLLVAGCVPGQPADKDAIGGVFD